MRQGFILCAETRCKFNKRLNAMSFCNFKTIRIGEYGQCEECEIPEDEIEKDADERKG